MRELNKIAEDLFDKIRSRFENVSIGDDKAKSTIDPTKARFFNFDYIDKTGDNYGNITISIVDENSLKIYFTKDIGRELDKDQLDDWYSFLRSLRQFAKRNLLSFDTRDINRSNLQVRDLKNISKVDSTYKPGEIDIHESKMYGNTRNSYQMVGPVRLVVRHTSGIDEAAHGARTRNIESIFIETQVGERFLLPFNKLAPARAMARHVSEGGTVHDSIGTHITNTVTEMRDLSIFVRKMRNRTFEDIETTGMVSASVDRYNQLHQQLTQMRGTKGYKTFVENFQPNTTIVEDDEVDMAALKEKFVQRVFDDRLSEALPHVYRAYKTKQQTMENKYTAEFEDWTNQIQEGTWATPDQDEDQDKLRELMSAPIEAGNDGTNASGVFDNIIGSDSLFDEFRDLSRSDQGASSDVRPLVIEWLKEHGYNELADELNQLITTATTATTATPTATPPTTQANVQPATESVNTILKLAGLNTLRRI